jgi:hypothetical protein
LEITWKDQLTYRYFKKDELKLKIEDYSNNNVRKELIRGYYELLTDYIVLKSNYICSYSPTFNDYY